MLTAAPQTWSFYAWLFEVGHSFSLGHFFDCLVWLVYPSRWPIAVDSPGPKCLLVTFIAASYSPHPSSSSEQCAIVAFECCSCFISVCHAAKCSRCHALARPVCQARTESVLLHRILTRSFSNPFIVRELGSDYVATCLMLLTSPQDIDTHCNCCWNPKHKKSFCYLRLLNLQPFKILEVV